jgi:hypothetical protein
MSLLKKLGPIASFLLVVIAYPVFVDQGWFRYNAYLLPCLMFLCILIYAVRLATSFQCRELAKALIFKVPIFASFLIFSAAIGLFALLFVQGLRFSIGVSKNHIARLLQKDSPVGTEASPSIPPTLQSLFTSDFPNLFKFTISGEVKFKDGTVVTVKSQEYADFLGKTSFFGFYVSETPYTFRTCERLANEISALFDKIQHDVASETSSDGFETTTSLKNLVFSGRVFVYHETPLTLKEKSELTDYFKNKKLDVQFRGVAYLQQESVARALREKQKK